MYADDITLHKSEEIINNEVITLTEWLRCK